LILKFQIFLASPERWHWASGSIRDPGRETAGN
jgi:hypothetical protein